VYVLYVIVITCTCQCDSIRELDDDNEDELECGEHPTRFSNSLVSWLVKFVPKSDDT